MLISDLVKNTSNSGVVEIICEQEFERFSRTTSANNKPCCVYIASEKYIPTIPECAKMVITTGSIAEKLSHNHFGICISSDPKATYFRLFVASSESIKASMPETVIGDNCIIGKNCFISEKGVVIGNNVIIEDYASIYENVVIGNDCIIRAGARIGVQDYNYFADNNKLIHLPHYGDLIIEDDVEIGFNSVVGRSLYPGDHTIIGKGSKLANHCAIGHDCVLGQRVMIYANAMVAGFCKVGDDTHIAMNASIKNGITIGSNVQINIGSVVIRNIPDNHVVFGNPARRVISPA